MFDNFFDTFLSILMHLYDVFCNIACTFDLLIVLQLQFIEETNRLLILTMRRPYGKLLSLFVIFTYLLFIVCIFCQIIILQ